MDARRKSFNKNYARKSFVTKASYGHTHETHVLEVYTPMRSHKLI